jgi:putative colanic acid biosynthesis glycosyltransferase
MVDTDLIEGQFAYGWDRKGFKNADFPEDVICTSFPFAVHLNFVAFPFTNENIIGARHNLLSKLWENTDIVHIHNVHSYGFTLQQLAELQARYPRPVVVTMHDSWLLTGRCSILENCSGYLTGCTKCPTLSNYHPVLFDRAKAVFGKKRKEISNLNISRFVSPADHLREAFSSVFEETECITINNGTNTKGFADKVFVSTNSGPVKCLIVDSNFSASPKIDLPYLQAIADSKVIELVTVGLNSPFTGSNVSNLGYLNSREEMIDVIRNCDVMLYFSRVDTYPLTLIEGLCGGAFVCAHDSPAYREITNGFDAMELPSNPSGFLDTIQRPEVVQRIRSTENKNQRVKRAIEKYSFKKVVEEYHNLYKELI